MKAKRQMRQKFLFIVRELGSRLNPSRLNELSVFDNTVVLCQQLDESEPALLTRAAKRLQKIDTQRDAIESAVIGCGDITTPEVFTERYKLARQIMRALSAGGKLALSIDASASRACRYAVTLMVHLLNLEFRRAAPLAAIGVSVMLLS